MIISAVIPARYFSTRFPGKPLVKIMGKPMVQHVYEAAMESNLFDQVWVATDHPEIFSCVQSFSGRAVLTSDKHQSGTDRVGEAVQNIKADAIINIQGDEPLVDGAVLKKICHELLLEESVVTAAFYSDNQQWFLSPDHVKVVLDKAGYALYFSRSGIPFFKGDNKFGFWHHIGIYGYQKKSLMHFVSLKKSMLEEKESLEQLRLLENGIKIKVVEAAHHGFGVDRPQDLLLVEELMKKRRGANVNI